jgi:hypothetical protein
VCRDRFVPAKQFSGRIEQVGDRNYPKNISRLALTQYREITMSDEHQVNSIIATAIFDARKDHPDGRIDPEEAKQFAKCVIEALSSAGLQIVPVSSN